MTIVTEPGHSVLLQTNGGKTEAPVSRRWQGKSVGRIATVPPSPHLPQNPLARKPLPERTMDWGTRNAIIIFVVIVVILIVMYVVGSGKDVYY